MSNDIRVTPEVRGVGIADFGLVQNGNIADGYAASALANFLYSQLLRRSKVLYHRAFPLGTFAPSGQTHRGRLRPGFHEEFDNVFCTVLFGDSGTFGAAGFTSFLVGGVSQLPSIPDPVNSAAVSAGPLHFRRVTFRLSPIATTTDISWAAAANSAIQSVIIYGGVLASSATYAGIASPSQYVAGAPVTTFDFSNLMLYAFEMHKSMGTTYFTWSGAISATGTTWVNVTDASTTGYAATAAGFQVIPQLQSTMTGTTVPCTFWVYASSTGVNGRVRISNSTGVLATITGITAAGFYSTTFNLDPTLTSSDLVVVEFSEAAGGATVNVNGCGLYALTP
jgi:hypothetical protein